MLVRLVTYTNLICSLVGIKILKLIKGKVRWYNRLKNWNELIPPCFMNIFLTTQRWSINFFQDWKKIRKCPERRLISIPKFQEKRARFHYYKNESLCVKTFASYQTCGLYLCLTIIYLFLKINYSCVNFFSILQICKDSQFSNTKIKNSKIQVKNKAQTLRKSYTFPNKFCTRREHINISNYNNYNNNNNKKYIKKRKKEKREREREKNYKHTFEA